MSRQTSKQLTRAKLLDQGVTLIMEHGYHGAGLQTILQSVGVPKGSFYNYFPSKEDFSAEVIQHYIAPFIAALESQLERPGISAREALRDYFQVLIEEAARQGFRGGCLLGNLMGEVGETSEKCRVSLLTAVQRYRDKLAEALRRGQQEGSFRQDLTAATMADLLVNQWQGALLRMKVEQSVAPLTECTERLLNDYFHP
jgi:TetR/AcrR family transcriptional regulator, transcriptional repressor for nem operon